MTIPIYGTVEQQGRLTLHLHMLLWIKGALAPQEVRDKILDPDSDFQKSMVEYLESVHQGESFDWKLEDVIEKEDEDTNTLSSGRDILSPMCHGNRNIHFPTMVTP